MYLHMLSGFRPVRAKEAVQTQKVALCVSGIEITCCPCQIILNGNATAKPHFSPFFSIGNAEIMFQDKLFFFSVLKHCLQLMEVITS